MTTGNFKFAPKKVGLAALLEEQKRKDSAALPSGEAATTNALSTEIRYINPTDAPEKIRIIFDDSSSMEGERIKDAILGCEEFMRNCIPNTTAVAVHPMNYRNTDLTKLSVDLPALALLVQHITATGMTPLFATLWSAMGKLPYATRYIVFSDGSPNFDDFDYQDRCINKAVESLTPVDTVLITSYEANPESREYQTLKNLADKTGGYFLVFDRNKVDFKTAFGFLAPVQRLALVDDNFRARLQEGKV